jgi:hypothetical protein
LELLEFAIRYVVLKRGSSRKPWPGGLPLASQKEEGLGEGLGMTQSLKVWIIKKSPLKNHEVEKKHL